MLSLEPLGVTMLPARIAKSAQLHSPSGVVIAGSSGTKPSKVLGISAPLPGAGATYRRLGGMDSHAKFSAYFYFEKLYSNPTILIPLVGEVA